MKEKTIKGATAPKSSISSKVYGGREARKAGDVVTFVLSEEDNSLQFETKEFSIPYTKKEWSDHLKTHKRDILRVSNKEIVVKADKVEGIDFVNVIRPYMVFKTEDGQGISLTALSSLSSYKRFKEKFLNAENDEPLDINPSDYLMVSGTDNAIADQVAAWLNKDKESETPSLTIQFMVKILKTDLKGFDGDVIFPVFA